MIDLKAKPFYLDDAQIAWINSTIDSMTNEELIGQLFMPIGFSGDSDYLDNVILSKHVGGIMYRNGEKEEMQATHRYLQEHSKVPLLIGSNLEYGGNGAAIEGTFVGTQMQIAATGSFHHAYELGEVAAKEGKAVGVNWAFAPVCDIDMNWRNPITNYRTYGNNPDTVLECASNYVKAALKEGVIVSPKHFPGDGWDEVDQHILTGVNGLTPEQWDNTYGKIYKGLIDIGVPAIMIGHIAQPAYEKALGGQAFPLRPATLSPTLLQELLRKKLGFNGLIISDSSCMVGFSCAMERKKAVPYTIEAGCDILLFNKDIAEDYDYMLNGLKEGILSKKRLIDAVTRILALKAFAGLCNKDSKEIVPNSDALNIIGCDEHISWAKEIADESITLVKDTTKVLPISPAKTKKVLLEVLGDFPQTPRIENKLSKLLTKEGFDVEIYVHEDFNNADFTVKTFKEKYDLVLYIANIENTSNMVTNRLSWYTFWGNGNNVPWFVKERPTVFVSVGNPYHLIDVPMMDTYINCYGNSDYTLEALVEKLVGHSEFKGNSPIDPFCGKEYLK